MIIVKSKKSLLALTFIAFLGVSFGVSLRYLPAKKTFFSEFSGKTVIVDAGHGLPDGGTVGHSGTVEHEVNLKLSKKLSEVLEGRGFSVILTREGEESLAFSEDSTIREMKVADMKMRREIIDKSGADLFLSVHMNSYPNESVSGLRFFYSGNHPEVKSLAENMQGSISKLTGAKCYEVKQTPSDLYLMKNIPVPAVLAECGFLSNPGEEQKLNDEEYLSKLAWAMADAICEYFK